MTPNELVGRFHSHLTVRTEDLEGFRQASIELGCKPTIIDLEREGRVQRDVMTTRYHRDAEPGALQRIRNELVELAKGLEERGFPVLRVKVEHESLPSLERFDRQHYHEVHIKLAVPEGDFEEVLAWLQRQPVLVPSRNPREKRAGVVHQFVNARLYEGTREEADAKVARWCDDLRARRLDIVEVKRESIVYDDSPGHDSWWL